MKRILLLGAAGQLGTGIRTVFAGGNTELTCLTRQEFDADTDSVDGKLSPYAGCDYLINCIAFHKVDQCEDNFHQSFRINAGLVLHLARFCAANDIALIHISTDYVFDGHKRDPYVETDLPGPLNLYGASKLTGELIAAAYAPKHFVLRVSSMFGAKLPYDPNSNFVEKMVDAARQRRALNVISDQVMSPTYAADVASAILKIIETGFSQYGLYHACNGGECTWYDFARTIFELTGLSVSLTPVTYEAFHTRAKRPQFCSMDNSRIGVVYPMRLWNEALLDYLRMRGYLKVENR